MKISNVNIAFNPQKRNIYNRFTEVSISGNLGMNILKFLQKKFFEKICKFFLLIKWGPGQIPNRLTMPNFACLWLNRERENDIDINRDR